MVDRRAKEALLGQTGRVIWLSGLSGSGKSTLSCSLERKLHEEGILTQVLDGDNVRTGLNAGLGFTDEDRSENIRRIAEVSKLFLQAGVVTINSFITPREELRRLVRAIVGDEDLVEVWVRCSFEECRRRDVKGLYARAEKGEVSHFTGKDSGFEPPARSDLVLDTERESPDESLRRLYEFVRPRIRST